MGAVAARALCAAWALTVIGCASSTAPADALDGPLPAPTVDAPASADGALQTAVLAGGCFWGMEAVFEHVRGVSEVVSGYSGGSAETALYETVGTGGTGHAEVVRITFDPTAVTFGQILRVYFSVAHDPTQVGGQYPDVGPQYRSAIFHLSESQRQVAAAYVAQLDATHLFRRPIATVLAPLAAFYPAEEEHQDYLVHHTTDPYVVTFDLPRLERLARFFPDLYVTR